MAMEPSKRTESYPLFDLERAEYEAVRTSLMHPPKPKGKRKK